ncbi:hypothetical protein CDAR_314081 [Caerostris darwini]|uniref:Uncharacterized protein n=1 Tax=Caerostris darwini TaxID=1538125 RepID=A0AAV4MZ95_9ARAC|nr:hypothetical protein CDAR_314081 [Caerostris darwini]
MRSHFTAPLFSGQAREVLDLVFIKRDLDNLAIKRRWCCNCDWSVIRKRNWVVDYYNAANVFKHDLPGRRLIFRSTTACSMRTTAFKCWRQNFIVFFPDLIDIGVVTASSHLSSLLCSEAVVGVGGISARNAQRGNKLETSVSPRRACKTATLFCSGEGKENFYILFGTSFPSSTHTHSYLPLWQNVPEALGHRVKWLRVLLKLIITKEQ